jgi:hypothetical protein
VSCRNDFIYAQLYEILSFKLWNYHDNYSKNEPQIVEHIGMSYIVTRPVKIHKPDLNNLGVCKLAGILNNDN